MTDLILLKKCLAWLFWLGLEPNIEGKKLNQFGSVELDVSIAQIIDLILTLVSQALNYTTAQISEGSRFELGLTIWTF